MFRPIRSECIHSDHRQSARQVPVAPPEDSPSTAFSPD
jgi:hypothetical protein